MHRIDVAVPDDLAHWVFDQSVDTPGATVAHVVQAALTIAMGQPLVMHAILGAVIADSERPRCQRCNNPLAACHECGDPAQCGEATCIKHTRPYGDRTYCQDSGTISGDERTTSTP
jgi:hypothetical protein